MYGDKSAGLNGRFADGLFSPMITQVCKNYGGSPETALYRVMDYLFSCPNI
jgi:hypothetical protein